MAADFKKSGTVRGGIIESNTNTVSIYNRDFVISDDAITGNTTNPVKCNEVKEI